MEYLVNDEERVWNGVPRVNLEAWIGWMMNHCDLDEQGTHLLTMLTAGRRYSLSRCGVEAKDGHKDSEHCKTTSVDSLKSLLLQNALCYMCVPVLTSTGSIRRI